MSVENLKNFIIKNKVIFIICIIIIVVGLLYSSKNENATSIVSIQMLNLNDKNNLLSIKNSEDQKILYNPISIYDDMLIYIDNNFKTNYIKLDFNGVPYENWNRCDEGKKLTLGLSRDTNKSKESTILFGVGTNKDLYYLPIINKFLDCKSGWKKIGNFDIEEITPVDGGCWITNTDKTHRIFSKKEDKWVSLSDTYRGKLKYDKVQNKIWGVDDFGFNFSTDVLENKSIENIKHTLGNITNYDVYNGKLFLITANKVKINERNYNIFRYDTFTHNNPFGDIIIHRFAPFQLIEEATDICITLDYVFVLSQKTLYRLDLNELNKELANEKITSITTTFTTYITLSKDVQKLYSHPQCLYILFKDLTIGYIKLGTNKSRETLLIENTDLIKTNTNLNNKIKILEDKEKNRVPCKTQFETNFSYYFNTKQKELKCKCDKTIESSPLKI